MVGHNETIRMSYPGFNCMDINQAAEYLNVSHKTIRRYVKAGKLKVVYVDGKGVYDSSEVEALKKDKQTPVHRAISLPESNQIKSLDMDRQVMLSEVVPTEQITHFLQIYERFYNFQLLNLKLTLTVEEAAEISGFSKTGLQRDLKSGILKAIKQGGRWRVRPQDLQEYVKCLYGEAGILRN